MDQDAPRRRASRAVRRVHVRRVGQALHRDAEGHGALRADDRSPRARNRRRLCGRPPRRTRDHARPGERRGDQTRRVKAVAGRLRAVTSHGNAPRIGTLRGACDASTARIARGRIGAAPAPAGAASARALFARGPENTHFSLPKTLTSSRWRHQSGCPNVLSGTSHKRSPFTPEKPHQAFLKGLTASSREGSPAAPVSTHPAPPGKAHVKAPVKPHL
ncbi:hypothetical protein BVI434_1810010 [Burkholderia vietnamiensis]|nr:hypothetical protein BVI434_1810010 [Burkholderia vietnamiensis]